MNKRLFQSLGLAACLSVTSMLHAKDVWLDELDLSTMTSGYLTPQLKKTIDGKTLMIQGKKYDRGVGTHADSRVVFQLDGKVRRFQAVVGVDDEANPTASVQYLVIADGETLFDSGIMKMKESKKVDVDLSGKKFVTLVLNDGGDGNVADHADWADAKFQYDGDKPAPYASDTRWEIQKDGGVTWTLKNDPLAIGHHDHIEMSGQFTSIIVRYGIEGDGTLKISRHIVWPMLRTIPNDTHGSLAHDFDGPLLPNIRVDGQPLGKEKPITISQNGIMTVRSSVGEGLELTRVISSSVKKPVAIEVFTLKNTGTQTRKVELDSLKEEFKTDPAKGVDGAYVLSSDSSKDANVSLAPGKIMTFSVVHSGRRASEKPIVVDAQEELKARMAWLQGIDHELVFNCPDEVLNQMFAFAKIRATESIFKTKGGMMHAPGGGRYYAAIWANDQAEYVNPLFAYLGDPVARESAENSFRHFARFMNKEWKPIPSSIVAEGDDIWAGAGDRGDAAMIAYGATRYAMAHGDKKVAEQLWPLIEWCLEYNIRKINADGVIASRTDELEGRFKAGNANLCTSSLAYDAFKSAAALGRELGKPKTLTEKYDQQAVDLRKSIDSFFGAKVEGFDTYRYFKENTLLRSWICIPLTVGIFERRDETIKALFSDRLWTEDGLATEAGNQTFWDRSTLYGLRGVFSAGATEKALEYLEKYSTRRLLGDHVPYAVEAYPEGNQRHLSAESGLYVRLIVEGMFGFHPTGLRSFTIQPRLPKNWPEMSLKNIDAFGTHIDIEVTRKGGKNKVTVKADGKTVVSQSYNETTPVSVKLK